MSRLRIRGVVAFAFLVGWGVLPPMAGAQSLAEVAKKERDRRARVEKEGEPAPVIGSEELEASQGRSLSLTGTKGESEAGARSEVAASPAEGRSALSDKEARELRETWARVWQEQMEQAQSELSVAQNDAYQCRSASRYFFVPLAIDCEGVEERLAAAQARLREVKQNRYNWQLLLPRGPGEDAASSASMPWVPTPPRTVVLRFALRSAEGASRRARMTFSAPC